MIPNESNSNFNTRLLCKRYSCFSSKIFLSVSLLCIISSAIVSLIYYLVVSSQLECLNKSGDAFSQTLEQWKSFHMQYIEISWSDSNVKENLANWERLTGELREEIFVMADGSHLKYPLSENEETNQEHKTTSIAVSQLLMNLKTMQQTDDLIRDITSKLYRNNYELFFCTDFARSVKARKFLETILRTLMQDFFRTLNCQLKTNEELRGEYKKRVNEAREAVNKDSHMSKPLIEIRGEYIRSDVLKILFEDKRTFRRSYLNDMFLDVLQGRVPGNSSDEFIELYSIVRALVEKAVTSPNSESKVNDVYQRVLIEGEEELWNRGIWTYSDRKYSEVEIAKILFPTLQRKIMTDPVLYEEINSLKKDINIPVYENTTINWATLFFGRNTFYNYIQY